MHIYKKMEYNVMLEKPCWNDEHYCLHVLEKRFMSYFDKIKNSMIIGLSLYGCHKFREGYLTSIEKKKCIYSTKFDQLL